MEIKGNYLHLRLRRSNKEIPYNENITFDKYPLQNQEYINQIANVVIKDNYRVYRDDSPEYWKISDPQIITMPCRIIRFDAEAPWVAVYVSLNYELVVTDSSRTPSQYPLIHSIQYNKDDMDIIGMSGDIQSGYIYNDNMLETFDFKGVVIKSDKSEPGVDVIIGLCSDEEYKVYLGSEVWFNMEGNIIDDPTMQSKIKTLEVRKMVLEGRVPYGIDQD